MVRDDFGMAATRFMAALDLPIVQGQNFATVDLFDPLHARKILVAYGRAFGRLPDSPGTVTKEQKAFLSQAVAGLAQEGKGIPLRQRSFRRRLLRRSRSTVSVRRACNQYARMAQPFCADRR